MVTVKHLTAPLLVLSFVLVVVPCASPSWAERQRARRWLGAGPLQFQPSELLKLALVLYAATLLASRPSVWRTFASWQPLLVVVARPALLVVSQPDLGTALVIAFTARRAARRGRHPDAQARLDRRDRARVRAALRPRPALCAGAADLVPGPLGARQVAAFRPCREDRDRLRRASSGSGPASRCRRSSTSPRRPPTSSSRSSPRSSAWWGLRAAVPLRADRLRGAARRQGGAQPVQRPDRGRGDLADPLAGAPQRVRRARPGAADRRAAAVRLLRLEQPDRDARRHGPAAERRRKARRAVAVAAPSRAHRRRASPRASQTGRSGGERAPKDRDRRRRDRRHVVPALAVADAAG